VALAVVAHGAVIAALLRLVAHPLHPPAEQSGYAMVLAPPAPVSPPASAPQTPTVLPDAAVQRQPELPVAPDKAAGSPRAATVQRRLAAARRPAPAASAIAQPEEAGAVRSVAPAPAPVVAAPDTGPALAQLETRIDQAVRAAATMPPMAIRQRREGRAQVRFDYTDGAVDSVQVVQSSQCRMLDDAAVHAVRHASYPPPPAFLHGRRLGLQVWINFRVAASPG
jgi:TonB family protein